MLTFTLTGSIHGILPTTVGLALAVLSSSPSRETWSVATLCCDPLLMYGIQCRYRAGDRVRIEGELAPRSREIGGSRFYDILFFGRTIERIAAEETRS